MSSTLQPTLLPPFHTSRVLETSTSEQRTYHHATRLLAARCSAAQLDEEYLVAAFRRFIQLLLGGAQEDVCFLFLSDASPSSQICSRSSDDSTSVDEDDDEDDVPSDFLLDVRSKLKSFDGGKSSHALVSQHLVFFYLQLSHDLIGTPTYDQCSVL